MSLFPRSRARLTTITGNSPRPLASGPASTNAPGTVFPKRSGETKVVAFMGGDYGHNRIPYEMHIRELFAPAENWRILFVRAGRFFTPELISDADLLILSRHSRPDDIGWTTDGITDAIPPGDHLWTDENVAAIIGNVSRRGMGLLALHNTIFSRHPLMTGFLGITPIPHNEIQPLWVRDLNRDHPITSGIGPFLIDLDEQFAAVIEDRSAVTLFETTALHDKRDAVGGWCLERGTGRVACLLPGHTQHAYRAPSYKEILWRAAHWSMRRSIPARTS